MKEFISDVILKNKDILCTHFNVKTLALYGSVARGNYNEFSDIDFVVEFNCPVGSIYIELIIFLNGLFSHKVDVITKYGTRPVFYDKIVSSLEFLIYE